jgi:dUTP pyrophosphatase
MSIKRRFEVVSAYKDCDINLPQRKTEDSAGYDIESAVDIVLPPGKVTIVPTGIKAYMPKDEFLGLYIRSGLSVKNSLTLVNNVGIIDADFVDNPDNEGNIGVPIFNLGEYDYHVKKGDRIAQGIFQPYRRTYNDIPGGKRLSGTGSTGK